MATIGEAEVREPILVGMIKHFHNVDRNTNLNAVFGMAANYADKTISEETYK